MPTPNLTASRPPPAAVAQHAMALILALTRQLHLAHDNQVRRYWRGMVSDLSQREDELGGKTLLVVGLGRIGSRLATLARCFGMRVVATKRDASTGADAADAVFAQDRLIDVLPQADIVALTCPLTPQTERLIGAPASPLWGLDNALITPHTGGETRRY